VRAESGNPKGRPKGARNRLGTRFLEALEADFNKFGPQAIALVREKKPEVYIKVVADLLPKEANMPVGQCAPALQCCAEPRAPGHSAEPQDR
jgi:hypothetical protein